MHITPHLRLGSFPSGFLPFMLFGMAPAVAVCNEAPAVVVPATGSVAARQEGATPQGQAPATPADAAVEAWRIELLDSAFRAASALPINPHIKNRSRIQESVAATCFALGLPNKGLRLVEGIENWRRGSGYADYAMAAADGGYGDVAQQFLDKAYVIVESLGEEDAQDWHRDRIRAKMASAYLTLGMQAEADLFGHGLVESEASILESRRVETEPVGEEDLRRAIARIESAVIDGNLDLVRNSVASCTRLIDRVYQEEEQRNALLLAIDLASEKLPMVLRLESLLDLGDIANSHGDAETALEMVGRGKQLIEGNPFRAEDAIALRARFAELRFHAGDLARAQDDADRALGMYEQTSFGITDIYRADGLRPLAEAYHAIGDRTGAELTYRRALEEGFVNPNLWPRAEDFAATCCSMAQNGFEPSEEIWDILHEQLEAMLGLR